MPLGTIIRVIAVWGLFLSAGGVKRAVADDGPEEFPLHRAETIAVLGEEACPTGFSLMLEDFRDAVYFMETPEAARKLVRRFLIIRPDAEGNKILLSTIDGAVDALCKLKCLKNPAIDWGRCPSRIKREIICPLKYPLLPPEAWKKAFDQVFDEQG